MTRSPPGTDAVATDGTANGMRRDVERRVRRLTYAVAFLAPALTIGFIGWLPAMGVTETASWAVDEPAASNLKAPHDVRVSYQGAAVTLKKGEMVVREGEILTEKHLAIVRALKLEDPERPSWMHALGMGFLTLFLCALGWYLSKKSKWRQHQSRRDVVFLSSVFVLTLLMARTWMIVSEPLHQRFSLIPFASLTYAMPLAAVALLTSLVMRVEIAIGFSLSLTIVLSLVTTIPNFLWIVPASGALVGATIVNRISARSQVLRAGVWVGLTQTVAAVGASLYFSDGSPQHHFINAAAAFLSGPLSAFVALSIAPLIELMFGYSTDLKLLELANLNHPALKELLVQAPGSYHHSMLVGTLVEAAAEVIDANPLLARVMAYYHDLGKGCNPGYFIENHRHGHNPHDKLKPSMSAMVIRRHVTDGIEIAKKYRLGEQIEAGIVEHHGTTLIHFFYHKAKDAEEAMGQSVAEADYRYPGRKPQTREAALVMLADSIEAASRSLADPNPARLQGLVQRIINHKFTDDQLEECDLTLNDLHLIAKAFSRVLMSIYHTRPEYPEILADLTGKRSHGDTDHKHPKGGPAPSDPSETERHDNIRRLGLS